MEGYRKRQQLEHKIKTPKISRLIMNVWPPILPDLGLKITIRA